MISFGVDNLYPFSVNEMYAASHSARALRLVAKDAACELREVSRYTA